MNMKHAAAVLALLLASLAAPRARAEERYFALIVGHNGRPAASSDESLKPLRYADDDALSFYELEQEAGSDAIVLTVPDSETRRRYPEAADVARPPTMAEITQAITTLNAHMDAAAHAGHTPVFLFFYSGHGSRQQEKEAALTLLDGPLSQSALHEQVLDKVHAQTIHLVIDACHAEAVVRPRDVEAKTVDITPADLVAQLSAATASRYPRVGLVIASSGGNPAHEWDLYQSGVFTHEVISALRGAADVNHDGRVEYTELGAFLTAANREVLDPRARMQSIVQPPALRAHAALIRLDARATTGWLTSIPSSAGQFFVEDLRGNRIVDGHAEFGFSMSVAVPPDQVLFVRNGDREAELFVSSGVQKRFDALSFHSRPLRTRGAMESALETGLFLTPFGPGYYSGYVDRSDAVAVTGMPNVTGGPGPVAPEPVSTARSVVTWSLRGASVALLTSSLVFGGMAWDARADFETSTTQRGAAEANDRFKLDTTLTLTFLVPGVACAAASYLLGRHR